MSTPSISSYLDLNRILLLQDVSSKKRLFELLGELLVTDLTGIQDIQITEGLIARERLGTTALGEGVAIPHCRLENISKIRCAVIKLDEGVDFDAPDGVKVTFVCALLVPEEATDDHLSLLASLAEFLSKPKNREELRNCHSPQSILDSLSNTPKHAA